MSGPKRANGDGTVGENKTSWIGQYKRKTKSFSKKDYPAESREKILRNRVFLKAYREWQAEVDAELDRGPVVTMSILFDNYLARLRLNGRGVYIERLRVEKHLRPRLGSLDASRLNLYDVDDYKLERKEETTRTGACTRNGTINRELAIITNCLRHMRPEPRLLLIEKLDESDGIRQGVVSVGDYQLFLRELEDYQKPLWVFSYYTGVRQGQLLRFRRAWAQDWESTGVLDVPGYLGSERITKNGKPHHIPVYSAGMREMLKWAIQMGDPACPYLFQREGKQISRYTFHDAFKRVAVRLGRNAVLFHDLRRTAVTNMIEAGIPPEKAKDVSGHLTMSVFERYNIITAAKARASVKATGEVLAKWHDEKNILAAGYTKITQQNSETVEGQPAYGSKPN